MCVELSYGTLLILSMLMRVIHFYFYLFHGSVLLEVIK